MFSREEWIGRLVQSPNVLKVLPPDAPRRSSTTSPSTSKVKRCASGWSTIRDPTSKVVRAIVEQIAKGLRAFHRKDIIHQDLKPENVMIDRHGPVKIIDFGSSRAASQSEAGSPVEAPDLVGTIDYTAPEYHHGRTRHEPVRHLLAWRYRL